MVPYGTENTVYQSNNILKDTTIYDIFQTFQQLFSNIFLLSSLIIISLRT